MRKPGRTECARKRRFPAPHASGRAKTCLHTPFSLTEPLGATAAGGRREGFCKSLDKVLAWVYKHGPEGILLPSASNNVVRWLQNAGFRVPQDVGVAALDLRQPDAGMSGIFQNAGGRAMYAIDHLIMKVEANRFGIPATPVTLLLESQWIDGPTTQQRKEPRKTKKAQRQ